MWPDSPIKIVLVTVFWMLFGFVAETYCSILTVTTLSDTDDGVCNSHCSLREAIQASADEDTIIFARNLRGGTIELQSTLTIQKVITIDGPNRRRITLKGNGTFGILHIGGTTGIYTRVYIDGLIIRNGLAERGGGIYLDATDHLTLENCLITKNHAAVGGGIRAYFGDLTLINSTVSDNTSDGPMGAAGIDAYDIIAVRLFNSTIAGNTAADGTGGVMVYFGEPLVINSSIVDNRSFGTGQGRVGGISRYYSNIMSTGGIGNSIIARNTGEIADLKGFPTAGSSLIGNGDGSGLVQGGATYIGTTANPIDPRLSPFADNGGGLPTYALLSNSLAINAANNDLIFNPPDYWSVPPVLAFSDQRGFDRFVNRRVDMGAVEYGGSPVITPSTVMGRVLTVSGRGLAGTRVVMSDSQGNTRIALTNSSGYYRFAGVVVDRTYTVEIQGKRYRSEPQTLLVEEDKEYVDFVVN